MDYEFNLSNGLRIQPIIARISCEHPSAFLSSAMNDRHCKREALRFQQSEVWWSVEVRDFNREKFWRSAALKESFCLLIRNPLVDKQ